jgi:Tol biopolymer transport system component
MTDERVDAILRRLDVAATPDPEFAASTASLLQSRLRAARVDDLRPLAGLRADLRRAVQLGVSWTRTPRAAIVGLAWLVLLALFAGLIALAGAINRHPPIGNGPLILALDGQLRAIDMDDGTTRLIGSPDDHATFVSRSPDGKLLAFWRHDPAGDQLMVIGSDGQAPRRVASNVAVTTGDGPGAWSADSRFVAAEVTANAASRILVLDVAAETGRFVTPASSGAHWPLWSPDGRWIAFARDTGPETRVLSIVREDGTETRDVSGHLADSAQVDGANSWSPDGMWIYFGANPSIWRANVASGTSTRLTDSRILAAGPALSPDGTLLSYIVSTPSDWDLRVANSDGTRPHMVLRDARNLGWSADGRYVLGRWMPLDQPGGLALVSPDGSGYRLVVPAAQACPDPNTSCDIDWGQPKP